LKTASVNLRENNHNVNASCRQRRKSETDQAVAGKVLSDGRYVHFHTLGYASVGPTIFRLYLIENSL
jgi:hypothetical protein